MELEDLKKQWDGLDAKLDGALRLNRRFLEERALERADKAMARHVWALAAEVALGVVAVLLTGSFVAEHVREARFLLPGAVLHVFVIAQIGMLVRQIVETRRIDYAEPLVEIQRRIGTLRVSAIRRTAWTFILAPLVWTPLCIVALRGFLGVDAYAAFGTQYIVANLALGVAVVAAGMVASRLYADRFSASPFGRRLMGALAGTSLAAATAHLEALSRFEHEGAAA
jgi:hypothetical protein